MRAHAHYRARGGGAKPITLAASGHWEAGNGPDARSLRSPARKPRQSGAIQLSETEGAGIQTSDLKNAPKETRAT